MKKNECKRLEIYYNDGLTEDTLILNIISIVKKKISDLDIYLIDCENHNQAICDPYKLKYLPHLIFRYQGMQEDIDGTIQPLQIIEKILNFQASPITYLEAEQDYQKVDNAINRDGICLFQIGSLNEKLIKFLSIEGIKHKDEFKIFSVQNEDILKKFGLEHAKDGIYLLRDNPPSVILYKYQQTLENFVHKYLFKNLPILTKKFWQKNQKNFKQKTVIIFNGKQCDENEHKFFQKIYTFYDLDHFKFYEVNKEKDGQFYDQIRSLFGYDDQCGMIIVEKINDFTWNKVVFPGELNLEQVNEFFLELEDNKIPLYFKFQVENNSNKNELNGLNFERIKELIQENFFVLFHTEKSKNSNVYKSFQNLIKEKQENENFELFNFNLDKNDVQSFIVHQEPLILYFDYQNPQNPISYNQNISLEEMRKFSQQKITDL